MRVSASGFSHWTVTAVHTQRHQLLIGSVSITTILHHECLYLATWKKDATVTCSGLGFDFVIYKLYFSSEVHVSADMCLLQAVRTVGIR